MREKVLEAYKEKIKPKDTIPVASDKEQQKQIATKLGDCV